MADSLPPLTDLDTAPVNPTAPLMIFDVDEVLAQFVRGFSTYAARHGYEFRRDRYALFSNLYRTGASESVEPSTGTDLYNAFFLEGAADLEPADGAADALATLSTKGQVLILTNAPPPCRAVRKDWLKTHGFDYPMIINEGPKGPAIATLSGRTIGHATFVDDMLQHLDSAAVHAPAVSRFQMVADEGLRAMAPAKLDLHPRYDDWPSLHRAIEQAIAKP
jgi:hypothetical protein